MWLRPKCDFTATQVPLFLSENYKNGDAVSVFYFVSFDEQLYIYIYWYLLTCIKIISKVLLVEAKQYLLLLFTAYAWYYGVLITVLYKSF